MKRLFDLTLAVISLPLLFLPFCIIFVLVKLTSKGPAIHWSKRIGLENRLFSMPKFRTMYVNTPQKATHLLKGGENFTTPLGKILRKLSLDEIPQIISILRGDMSFVGPRPALYNQGDLKEMRTEREIHKILPGLTGWAQINGRDEIGLDEKVELDYYYKMNQSLILDCIIIAKTFLKVFGDDQIQH